MRQIGIIPAGCQQHFFGGVVTTKLYYCYASTVAIYFLNPKSFKIEKIIAYNDRAISSFSISTVDPNLIVIGSVGILTFWISLNCYS
jgi:hypothetical protein